MNLVIDHVGLWCQDLEAMRHFYETYNDNFQHLGSVVTNHGYSDWATTEFQQMSKVCGIA